MSNFEGHDTPGLKGMAEAADAYRVVREITNIIKDMVPPGYGVLLAICQEGEPVGATLGGVDTFSRCYDDMLICLAGKIYEARFQQGAHERMSATKPGDSKH
jgi:hypothetical protein